MAYYLLASAAFRRHLQYRWAHMINNLASVGFGYIFIAIWHAVPQERLADAPGAFTHQMLAHYVALGQTMIWIAFFIPVGLGIAGEIRTGRIALEMAKPLPFFPMVVVKEAGSVLYHLVFRALPMAAIFALTTGFAVPKQPLLFAVSAFIASYIALCLHYLMGITAFWTKEIRWVWWLFQSTVVLNGLWLPVDLLPDLVREVALALPFAAQIYYPASIYFGLRGAEALLPSLTWAAVLTACCIAVTGQARRHLEVQGG